ncbi:MAG: gliding motility lipoprotein GldD [Flavobacteriaceae bacterium]
MSMFRFLFCLIFMLVLIGCSDTILPKPNGLLRLQYPKAVYKTHQQNIPFQYEYNQIATIERGLKQAHSIVYPKMKATLYLSYVPVTNNLDSLLTDAYKLPSKHIGKAQEIPERLFINPDHRVYGTLFKVVGDAASQLQFFLTDSVRHFMVGSLYFYSRPNYDSLLPALEYIEKDVVHLMETLEWKPKK